jgi:hypothetical protein
LSRPDGHSTGLPAVVNSRDLARRDSTQIVAAAGTAAGTAIVTAAKVGRLMTRAGWGFARRFPGGETVQREVQKIQDAAITEVRRILDIPDEQPKRNGHDDEARRVMMLINGSYDDMSPLRGAMSELLERAVESNRDTSRDYLYGNIISQLVPDEARILAALSDGTAYAALDVIGKHRSGTRTVLSNASTVGRQSGVAVVSNTATYVTRLYRFGLVEFGPQRDEIAMQYDILATESEVQAAVALVEAQRLGSPKLINKSVSISTFGRDFWSACDPSRPGISG